MGLEVPHPKSTTLCAFGMLSSFPMVMDQAIGWDLLSTSAAKAMTEGTRDTLLILGKDAACFPKVPPKRDGTQRDATSPKQ